MDFNERREWLLKNQFDIPKRIECIAHAYGNDLTYNDVTYLYSAAVKEILKTYNVEIISDIGFAKGYVEAEKLWIKKMEDCIKIKKENSYLYKRLIKPIRHNCFCQIGFSPTDTPLEDNWYDESEEDMLREKYKKFEDPYDSLIFEERYIKIIDN